MRAQPDELSFTFEGKGGEAVQILFLVSQLPPIPALKLASKLGRVLGPAIGDLLAQFKDGAQTAIDLPRLGVGLQKVCEDLDDAQIDALVSALLQSVQTLKDGKTSSVTKELFNTLFTGHLRESFQLLVLSAKVNFADFFPGAPGPAK